MSWREMLFKIHAVAVFKVFNWRSWSFVIPWWCSWPHNLISLEGEMTSKLMREELREEGTNPIIRTVAEVRQGFGMVKIQSL